MSAYGYQYYTRPGLAHGIDFRYIETKKAAVAFEYGEPVFVQTGAPDVGVAPDSTDATRVFYGVAMLDHKSTKTGFGTYDVGDAVNVGTRGEVWVRIVSGLSTIGGTAAYVDNVTGSGTYKLFTNSNSSTYAVGSVFKSNSVTGSLVINGSLTTIYMAILELRGVK